jgi:hypothetical protein
MIAAKSFAFRSLSARGYQIIMARDILNTKGGLRCDRSISSKSEHPSSKSKRKRPNSFLTEGYQPTTRELLDFDDFVSVGRSTLPILDATVIL